MSKNKAKSLLALLIGVTAIVLTFSLINGFIYNIAEGVPQPLHAVIILIFWIIAFSTTLGLSVLISLGLVLLIAWVFNW